MILAFAPFIAFAVLNHFLAPTAALVAAALVSVGLIVRGSRYWRRSAKIHRNRSTCLPVRWLWRSTLTCRMPIGRSLASSKMAVDLGLFAIVLFSLVIDRPFTVQYARESVPPEMWESPQFLRTNQTITLVWLAAFSAIIMADLVLRYLTVVPQKLSVFLTIGALYGAFKFTMAYPTSS